MRWRPPERRPVPLVSALTPAPTCAQAAGRGHASPRSQRGLEHDGDAEVRRDGPVSPRCLGRNVTKMISGWDPRLRRLRRTNPLTSNSCYRMMRAPEATLGGDVMMTVPVLAPSSERQQRRSTGGKDSRLRPTSAAVNRRRDGAVDPTRLPAWCPQHGRDATNMDQFVPEFLLARPRRCNRAHQCRSWVPCPCRRGPKGVVGRTTVGNAHR